MPALPSFMSKIGTALPAHEVHGLFVDFALARLPPREAAAFRRLVARARIRTRYSVLAPAGDGLGLDRDGLYIPGAFADTARRMAVYRAEAPPLAVAAVRALAPPGSSALAGVSHLVLASCTGFVAPGPDLALADAIGLEAGVQRTLVGFMGCAAAINALRVADALVRADAGARVLVVAVELCTLHLQESDDPAQLLCFLQFADGAAATIVSAEPDADCSARIDGFASQVIPGTSDLIGWEVGALGFDMRLSARLPATLARTLPATMAVLEPPAADPAALWAVHPGGRAVLDAAESALALPPAALEASRAVLGMAGNMSSPSVLFVLARLLASASQGAQGLALAFGPGVAVEAMRFTAWRRAAGQAA